MASRKEEKERLRQARIEAERRDQSEQRRKLLLGYVGAGVITAVVVAGIVALIVGAAGGTGNDDPAAVDSPNVNTDFGIAPAGVPIDEREGTPPGPVEIGDLEAAAEAAGCERRFDLPIEGANHLPRFNEDPDFDPGWETSPPTSGDHHETPLADGAWLETPPLGFAVHALEHGRVIINYQPDLPEPAQLALKGVFDSDRGGVITYPFDEMPWTVAATAWGNKLGCEEFEGQPTIDAILLFIQQFRGAGPENVPF